MAKDKGETHVVPMPAFLNPANPKTMAGSINFGVAGSFPGLDKHPVKHADSYGKAGLAAVPAKASPASNDEDGEEDRSKWLKPDWKELADAYGLATSGTTDELIERVEAHEATLGQEGGQ